MRALPILAWLPLAATLACGSGDEAPSPAPAAPKEAAAPPPRPATPPAPVETGGIETADAAAGEKLYGVYCASCHGARGEGDGPVAASLDPQPAKHSDAAYMNALSDEHLFTVIKKGGPGVGKSALMAPWGGTLTDAQIWDVVAFTRTLAEG